MADSNLNLTYRTKKQGNATQELQRELKDLDKATGGLVTVAKTLAGPAVLGAVAVGLHQAMLKTIDAAKEVRDLSRTIGATPEEASKLIQAADDMGIASTTLQGAMEAAIKRGVEPTIEGVGELADQYLAIQDPIARSKFLMDNFGKAGNDLAPLMEQGAKGIKRLGDEAEATGLVLSKELVQSAREFEKSTDALSDATSGYLTLLTSQGIPILTDFNNILARGITLTNQLEVARRQGALTDREAAAVSDAVKYGYFSVGEASEYATNKVEDYRVELAALMAETSRHVGANKEVTDATAAYSARLQGLADAMGVVGQANFSLGEDLDGLKTDLDELTTIISGPVGQAQDEYYQKQKDAGAAIVETQDRIKELTALPQLTDAQRAELDELQERLKDQKQAYLDNATAHEESTARIVFGFLTQKLAADGWQDGEIGFLAEVGKAWGIYDEKTATVLGAVDANLAEHGTNARAFLQGIGSDISALPPYTQLVIETIHKDTWLTAAAAEPGPAAPVVIPPGPDEVHDNRRALGGPVTGGVPYVVGEVGPEIFVPHQGGFVLNRQDAMAAVAGHPAGGGGVDMSLMEHILDRQAERLTRAIRDALMKSR